MTLKVLSQRDVKLCITMEQAISAMESAFQQLHAGKAELPLRTTLPIKKENGLTLTMPAYLGEQNALGLKVVSVFPNNSLVNKPAINGAILLLDDKTGEALALMEASYLTALRTGAVSGLATKYLARGNVKNVAIIGSGVQALTQLEAVAAVRNIQKVTLWSRDYNNALAFAKRIESEFDVECYPQIVDALRDADVICTATGSEEPLIHLADIKPDAHINAVGSHNQSMCEISNEVIASAFVVVDQIQAALAEAGEIIAAIGAKYLRKEDMVELGEVVSDVVKRQHKLTLFKSVGLAIQDISVAHVVYKNALAQRLGTSVAF